MNLEPENCQSVRVPAVNLEVWSRMAPHTRSNDIKLQIVEKLLCKAIVSLRILTDKLLKEKEASEDKSQKCVKTVKTTLDAVRLIGQAQQELNGFRRMEIRPDVNPEYKQLCSASHIKTTKLLFGDDLTKSIKDLNETNKMKGKLTQRFKGRSKFANKGKSFLGQRPFHNANP